MCLVFCFYMYLYKMSVFITLFVDIEYVSAM